MDIKIYPGKLTGTVTAIPSKSYAHRLLICAAFSDKPTFLRCPETNQDIEATVSCLNAIGANISRVSDGYYVEPVRKIPQYAVMDCHESGSTLRFMLPIVCALGIDATLHMAGRLPQRPLSPLWEEIQRMGCTLARPTDDTIQTAGRLLPGNYKIPGNISSQFITGLLFALSLIDGASSINICGKLESRPYIDMTQEALRIFGVCTEGYITKGSFPFRSPGNIDVEGDWSNAAFFLVAAEHGNQITVEDLNPQSLQGDRAVAEILKMQEAVPVISAANIPDLIPVLAVHFAGKNGAKFTDISRLRLKESDRVASVSRMLSALGIRNESSEDTIIVHAGTFTEGIVDSYGDHRIAMAACIASTISNHPVIVKGAECVAKSYPAFWQEFLRLGGKYEQYIR